MRSTVARIAAAVRITAVVRVPTTVVDTTQTRMVVIMQEKRTHTIRTDITRIQKPPTATDSINLDVPGSDRPLCIIYLRKLADRSQNGTSSANDALIRYPMGEVACRKLAAPQTRKPYANF
jgi:hypothetical protein